MINKSFILLLCDPKAIASYLVFLISNSFMPAYHNNAFHKPWQSTLRLHDYNNYWYKYVSIHNNE